MMGMENVTFNKYGQNELASSDEGIRGIFQHPGGTSESLLSSVLIPCPGCSERGLQR